MHKKHSKTGDPAVGSTRWLVRLMSVWRRPQPPALYEFYGCTAQEELDRRHKLFAAIEALGETTDTIAIFCGGGIAEVVDARDPMRRVAVVIDRIRPRYGKASHLRALEEFIKQTQLYEQRLSVRVIKKLTDLTRSLFKRDHRTNK